MDVGYLRHEENARMSLQKKRETIQRDWKQAKREEKTVTEPRILERCVCAVFGHATSTRCSVVVGWKGNQNIQNVWSNQPVGLLRTGLDPIFMMRYCQELPSLVK